MSTLARATVTDVMPRPDNDEDNLYVFSYLDPTSGGQVVTNPISWPATFKQGQAVEILYDPSNPRTSLRVDNFFRLWAMTIIPALASLMLL